LTVVKPGFIVICTEEKGGIGVKVVFVIAVFIVIGLLDVPNLIKSRQWKELVVFSLLFITGFSLSFLMAIGVKLPSPILAAQDLIENVLNLHY